MEERFPFWKKLCAACFLNFLHALSFQVAFKVMWHSFFLSCPSFNLPYVSFWLLFLQFYNPDICTTTNLSEVRNDISALEPAYFLFSLDSTCMRLQTSRIDSWLWPFSMHACHSLDTIKWGLFIPFALHGNVSGFGSRLVLHNFSATLLPIWRT